MSGPDPVIIVGAGPAGTSAALALVERGIPVRVLEAGTAAVKLPPAGNYLDLRFRDPEQWLWQIGASGEALQAQATASPKLRVPGLRPIFQGYAESNRLKPEPGFHLVGALAPGGLSNAWGCGVASFDNDELGPLASERAAMQASYSRVATRMGISGANDDCLRDVVGLDAYAGPALPLDSLHQRLWDRRGRVERMDGFALGRSRVAVLGEPRSDRAACDLSGSCLWGCANKATWSAALDVATLRRHPLARVESGMHVQALNPDGDGGWWVDADSAAGPQRFHGRNVLLAAGTIASTRLALVALPDPPRRIRLQSNPMAAFLLWLPGALGTARTPSFGLAQLSFTASTPDDGPAFGNTFSTCGLPVGEFLAHLPTSRRAGLPLLRGLLPSTVVGNVFLPGELSEHSVGLNADGSLGIEGGASSRLPEAVASVRRTLAVGFRRLGAWMLPGSFVVGATGADLHYASTLPIRIRPARHECDLDGQIAGLPGVYAVDGASLPLLPAKAHTLTLMANADRIARKLQA
ncbi:choline dehydrogenase-like flavoprotein [Lysobacter niabensis]|uniref:Choline dehydrogenase-like flavoprotein n=1 Tax=Agrilutibacter niabensis TaxID=380628 RepID=A0ABU1VTK8_9GAMM|nr:FAD-dependent monooxygenase [Lysobacter niabensis]MDR7100826.1 choline dehydrogenase-like flavoprotein [Lysobacter niabensis]